MAVGNDRVRHKKGRVHSSTVTVAVLEEPTKFEFHLDERDVEWQACRGSGAGGQHRNVTDSAIQMVHKPSGIRVRVETERSQHMNRAFALELLRARVYELERGKKAKARENKRREQVGSGERSDKVRTVRVQDGMVTDHRSETKIRFKDYARGEWGDLLTNANLYIQ